MFDGGRLYASATFEPHDILGVPTGGAPRVSRHLRSRIASSARGEGHVRAGATVTVVKRAYRALARTAHPDKGGDPARFRLIVQAYEALMNRLHGIPEY